MNSCILTVIKNEHEYLDEWIKYHLDLGINHIFILEDIDSDSHKDICDKYGDRVSLNSVLSVLNEVQRKEAKLVKELNKYSVQHMYFRNGLNYLKRKYSDIYDWCFIIDNDEFITLENDTLEDVLNQFNNYEAFVISWKCYGANGLIHKPNKGVVESFTTEAKGKIPNQVKTCYKLKSYRKEFLYTHITIQQTYVIGAILIMLSSIKLPHTISYISDIISLNLGKNMYGKERQGVILGEEKGTLIISSS